MNMIELIEKKREGFMLSHEEIEFFVDGYTKGDIPDYQASAFLMAVYFKGLNTTETADLTACMRDSGEKIDLSQFGGLCADKHSTGGVGDKTTLIVAPLAACLGCKIAKMSGRGLGHTGGTVDKLESIKGFQTELSPSAFVEQVKKVGVAVIGQSGDLAPADKKLYALRDVTATVDSIPLIASSIMSKKLAAGNDVIVLDVKAGSGAFMKTVEEAKILAQTMVNIGTSCHKKTAAVLSNMDVPLGYAIGNALEVREALEILKGGGCADLKEVCLTLASQMAALVRNVPLEITRKEAEEALKSGAALQKFKEWIAAQGGDISFIEKPETLCPAPVKEIFPSPKSGYIKFMDAARLGKTAGVLGAGRMKKGDPIDHSAGIVLGKKTGDYIEKGEPLAALYTSDKSLLPLAKELMRTSIIWSDKPPQKQGVIYEVIQNDEA